MSNLLKNPPAAVYSPVPSGLLKIFLFLVICRRVRSGRSLLKAELYVTFFSGSFKLLINYLLKAWYVSVLQFFPCVVFSCVHQRAGVAGRGV